MISIDQMISAQPGLILQVTGALPNKKLWLAMVFVFRYYYYCYAQLMRGTSAEETLNAKETY